MFREIALKTFCAAPAAFAFFSASASPAFSVGEYVSVPAVGIASGTWGGSAAVPAAGRTARILEVIDGGYMVEFYDYSDKIVSTAPTEGASKIEFKTYPVGKDVTVIWGDKPYAARILKVRDGFHWITYPGWPHSWDEWVGPERLNCRK
ncbi:MAG: hypothetical protein HY746_10165 [Elusimicrobia bacterium]|nr:hypothetical protein [Elusimicrobiota bacterium]